MSYLGYRIKIGDTIIPNNLIHPSSWRYTPTKKIIKQWEDANGTIHQDIRTIPRAEITFSIRVRTLDEHETIASVFATQESLTITYWDDVTCTYKTGTFFMDAPSFTHISTSTERILYDATEIHLTEY